MIVRCETCPRVYDDAESDTGCPHYPIGASAETFCKRCDLYKPCLCDDEAKPRTLRRFVNRGGQMVEVESVVRETR